MINATEARILTLESKATKANEWWKEFSFKLEEEIMKQINCRCDALIIEYNHKLNDFDWINSALLRNKVKLEAEALDYKFLYSGAGNSTTIEISWE